MQEIWKDIKGYEGYYKISNYGNIYIVKRNMYKKLTINKDGYYIVSLSKEDNKKTFLVHRLVAKTFLDTNDFKMLIDEIKEEVDLKTLTVNHKNENKLDNRANNLEWCTNKYNIIYSSKKNSKNNYKVKINKIIEYLNTNKIDNKTKKELLNIINFY